MSQANVEIVKRGIDAFNMRDVDAFAEVMTVDFEMFRRSPGLSREAATGDARA